MRSAPRWVGVSALTRIGSLDVAIEADFASGRV